MATIRPNDNAPADSVKYIFPLESFDLAVGGEFETDNRNTIAAATSHPWLDVEAPTVDELSEERDRKSVPYEDDVLTAPNSVAFDLEAVEAAKRLNATVDENPTAIQSGLDQGEVEEVGPVNVTLAADAADADEPDEKAPRKRATAKDKE